MRENVAIRTYPSETRPLNTGSNRRIVAAKRRGEEDIPEKEPEGEPSQVPSPQETEDEEVDAEEEEWVPELPAEAPQRPSVEEYQTRWDARKAWHARCVPGELSRDNLVPKPEPQLWQNCP